MPLSSGQNNRRWAAMWAFVTAWAAALLIVVGITAPIVSIDPGAKNSLLERLFEILFGESFEVQSASVVRGISQLFRHGEWQIGLVILCFSVVFPLLKVSILLGSSCAVYGGWTRTITNGVHRLTHGARRYLAPIYKFCCVQFSRRFDNRPRTPVARLPSSVREVGRECIALVMVMVPKNKLEWLEVLGPWSMADVFVVSLLVTTFKEFPGGTRISAEYGYWLFLGSVMLAMVSVALLKRRHQESGIDSPTATVRRGIWFRLCYLLLLVCLFTGALLSIWAQLVPRKLRFVPIPSPTAPHEVEIRTLAGLPSSMEIWLGYFGHSVLIVAFFVVFFLVLIRGRNVLES